MFTYNFNAFTKVQKLVFQLLIKQVILKINHLQSI
jgi:hypothetical protein